jgi:hypothetical protein
LIGGDLPVEPLREAAAEIVKPVDGEKLTEGGMFVGVRNVGKSVVWKKLILGREIVMMGVKKGLEVAEGFGDVAKTNAVRGMEGEDRTEYFAEKKKALADVIRRGGPTRTPKAAEALDIAARERIEKITLVLSRPFTPATRNVFERRAGEPLGLEDGKSAVHAAVLKEVCNRIKDLVAH